MVLLAMGPKQKNSKTKSKHYDGPAPHPTTSGQPPELERQGSVGGPSRSSPTDNNVETSRISSRPMKSPNDPETIEGRPTNRWSYYGSWRTLSKSSPVIQSTNESISVQQGTTSELSESGSIRRPSQALSKGMRSNRKSIAAIAEPTKVHATSDVSDKSRARHGSEEKLKTFEHGTASEKKKVDVGGCDDVVDDPPLPPEPSSMSDMVKKPVLEDAGSMGSAETLKPTPPQQGTGWFGWWSRPDGYDKATDQIDKPDERTIEIASGTALPITPNDENPAGNLENTVDTQSQADDIKVGSNSVSNTGYNASYRSWFGLWSSAQNELSAAPSDQIKKNDDQKAAPAPPQVTVSSEPVDIVGKSDAKEGSSNGGRKPDDELRPRTSGWAFWSTEKKGGDPMQLDGTQKQIGELAVADTPSQSHPEAAQFNEQQSKLDKAKALSAQLTESPSKASNNKLKERLAATTTPSVSQIPSPAEPLTPAEEVPPQPIARGKLPQIRPNLVSPSVADTYPEVWHPGYMERASSYLWHSIHSPPPTPQDAGFHIHRDPHHIPKIKKAIAIGVHGFFPTPLIQKVLGQPTGTSIRFANYAAAAIHAWCKEKQPDIKDVEVEKVALEGEGFIADRVTTLWKLLLNWLSHLRQAEFILLACHSQGVPVAFMLLAKLIQLGPLAPNVKIGVCAMAGVNMGPFVEYKSRLFGGAALELFNFANPQSTVSKSYAEALDVCLRAGVRVSYVGSLDDQLVSLESALFMPLTHPYVNRAVFIDGRLHAPDFLNHLVVLALKLKNLGVADHGIIKELSAPLAGSLVGGDGHSRVYDDAAVYRLAVDFAMESLDFTLPTSSSQQPGPTQPAPQSHQNASTATSSKNVAFARRAHTGGASASSTAAANSIRRGSFSTPSTVALPGVGPIFDYASVAKDSGASTPNPFFLPWAVRGLLSEDMIKHDEKLRQEVKTLVAEFEQWKPNSKVLKDVRWRLEGMRSLV